MIKGLIYVSIFAGACYGTYNMGYSKGESHAREQCSVVASRMWNERTSELEAVASAAMRALKDKIDESKGQRFDFSDEFMKKYLPEKK